MSWFELKDYWHEIGESSASISSPGLVAGQVPYATSGDTIAGDAGLTYDATTDTLSPVTVAARNVVVTALATPTITSPLVVNGTPGVTTYGYKRVDYLADGTSTAASAEVTIATGNATLSATNSITVSWPALAGSVSTRLYRTTGGAAPPKLLYTGTATSYVDTGAAGTAQAPATANTTGVVTAANVKISASTVGLGATAIPAGSTSAGSVALGDQAGFSLATGNFNFLGGYQAGRSLNGGGTNIVLGYQAGYVTGATPAAANALTVGNNVVFIGANTGYGSATQRFNATAIGPGAYVDANNTVVLGSAAVTDVLAGSAAQATMRAASFATAGANGSGVVITSGAELLTLATGATTTATAANLLPATSQILFITGRVTTTITTAANYAIAPTGGAAWVLAGTATSSLTGLTAGSTFVLVPPSNAVYTTSTANTITVTTNANPGAGAIRLVPFYVAITPPSS